MKKRILTLVCALVLLFSAVAVYAASYTSKQLRIANALNHIDLFLGTGSGYELDRELTRTEGMVLLVRMLGQEQIIKRGKYNCPFTDVDAWAVNYIGYAYENGITRGYSDTEFGANDPMTDYMFLTLTLRALGYTDKGERSEFSWDDPYVLANKIGLIASQKADTEFIRADAVEVFWNAFRLNDYEMAQNLLRSGVFTKERFDEAVEIYSYGRIVTGNETTGAEENPEQSELISPPAAKPSQTEPAKPSETAPETTPNVPSDLISYEEYLAMSGTEQEAFFTQFSDPMDFFAWLNVAKAEYDAKNPSIDVGEDGNIDLGDFNT